MNKLHKFQKQFFPSVGKYIYIFKSHNSDSKNFFVNPGKTNIFYVNNFKSSQQNLNYTFGFLVITAVLECAQKQAVSLPSALDNFKEAGEEGGRRYQERHGSLPGPKQLLGSPEGGFRVFERLTFSFFPFLPEFYCLTGK